MSLNQRTYTVGINLRIKMKQCPQLFSPRGLGLIPYSYTERDLQSYSALRYTVEACWHLLMVVLVVVVVVVVVVVAVAAVGT
jgi:hypothetical protein